jgi:hypothetical protein
MKDNTMNDYKRKLTLAVIYGNVENIMERFLRSFAPLVDEVVLVRAIGNQKIDASRYLAEQFFLGHHTPCQFAEYGNKDGNDWPHVDDFAAARQMAFNLASHDWVMWADTDDILDPKAIPVIRRALDGLDDQTVGIQMPYEVPEDAITIMRERIVRRDAWKWQSPIHECLMPLVEDATIGTLNSVKIVHAPISHRAPNNERNMRILESIPEAERTNSHRFHFMQTLDLVGRHEEAKNEAALLIQDPEISAVEKYQIYCFLAKSTDEPMRSQLYLQAVATDPSRREAYAELCKGAFARQKPKEMLAWARCLKAQPKPQEWPWNARRTLWGREGVEAHAMALRANLDFSGADAVELNHFKKHGAKISLLHATRGRFQQAAAARRKWMEKAANQDAIEHIFALDADDAESLQYLTLWRNVVVAPGSGPVRAWNAAAQACNGRVLIQLSDDWEPPMGWDQIILGRIGDTSKSAVLQVSDGHRTDDLLCMAILTRARYIEQGYLFHPDFFSMYSDDWFSECARRDGVVIDARDVVFEHLHPAFGKAEMDATYARSNAAERYAHGQVLLRRLMLEGDGDGVSPTGAFAQDLHFGQFNSPDLADWLIANLDKSTAVNDLGCGNGYLVEMLENNGIEVTGYEANPVCILHVKADLTTPIVFAKSGQTICIEVGEHVPAKFESQLLSNIAGSTAKNGLCVLSWAVPGQSGRGHVNCLPNDAVINKMKTLGFDHEEALTKSAREAVNDLPWLKNTLMVFRKA